MYERTKPDFLSYVAFDIETTGLGANAQIVEIGAAKVVGGDVTSTFSQLVNPVIPMNPSASAVNGITDSMLIGKPFIGSVIKDFSNFIGDSILVGHNIKHFDLNFILKAATNQGLRLHNSYFDTMLFARKIKHSLGWEKASLEYLMGVLGLKRNDAHRALGDALDVVALYSKICSVASQGYVSYSSSTPQRPSARVTLWEDWGNHIHQQQEQIKRQIRGALEGTRPVSVNRTAMTAQFSGTESIHTTGLTQCSCADYRNRKLPCKHMYRLASELGMHQLMTGISYSEIDNELLKDMRKLKDQLHRNPDNANMVDVSKQSQRNLGQHLAQCVEITKDSIGVTLFVRKVNVALSEKGKLKLQAKSITDLLLKDGYLEIDENGQRVASLNGNQAGITTQARQKESGEAYIQNLYGPRGQRLLLEYAMLALQEKLQ